MFSIFTLLIGFVESFSLAANPPCSAAAITKECNHLKARKSERIIKLSDGTFFRNPAFEDSGKSGAPAYPGDNKLSPKRRKAVLSLFEQVKNGILESIQKGRSESDLSKLEKAQIQRIRTISFDELNSDAHSACLGAVYNAHYFPTAHKLALCPAAFNLPDSGLAFIFGHEMGHAIDPCNLQLDLVKKNSMIGHESFGLEDSVLSATAQAKSDRPVVSSGLPVEEHGNSDFISCLKSQNIVNDLTDKDIEQVSESVSRRVRNELLEYQQKLPENSLASLKPRQREIVKKYPYCFSKNHKGSHWKELSSDRWGAIALGNHLEQHPLANELDRMAMFSLFLDEVCQKQVSVSEENREKDAYPQTLERWNWVVFSDPKIQKALSCDYQGPECFLGPGKSSQPAKIIPARK